MPATLNRPAVTCDFCEVPLTGGVDTYGGVGQSLCFLCFHKPPAPEEVSRNAFLEALRARLDGKAEDAAGEIEDAEMELRDARNRLDSIDCRIDAIDKELNGGPRCDEEETTTP